MINFLLAVLPAAALALMGPHHHPLMRRDIAKDAGNHKRRVEAAVEAKYSATSPTKLVSQSTSKSAAGDSTIVEEVAELVEKRAEVGDMFGITKKEVDLAAVEKEEAELAEKFAEAAWAVEKKDAGAAVKKNAEAAATKDFDASIKVITSGISDKTTDKGTPAWEQPAVLVTQRSSSQNTSVNTFSEFRACCIAVSVIISIVTFLYRSKGPLVVAKVIVYLLALTTMKGVVKVVQDGNSFKFPLFLTMTHFASGAFVAICILIRESVLKGETMAIPSIADYTTKFAPVAMASGSSVAMNNMALVHSTSAFVEIVGASSPVVTVFVMLAMKQPFDLKLLGPCGLVLVGCALTSNGEPRFSMIGLVLAFGANCPRALRTVLQHMLLKNDSNALVYSPVQLLAWTCLPSSLLMLVWSCMQEGSSPWYQWYQHGLTSQLTGAILVSCVNACILNTANLFVVRDLGAVGSQIVAQMKSVLVILGGMFFLNEKVSGLEFVGFFTVMVGVYAYNHIEAKSKAKDEAESGTVDEAVPPEEGIK